MKQAAVPGIVDLDQGLGRCRAARLDSPAVRRTARYPRYPWHGLHGSRRRLGSAGADRRLDAVELGLSLADLVVGLGSAEPVGQATHNQ